MAIGELCNREVVVIGKGESVLEAVRLMRRFHVGDIVVVEDRENRKYPVGILTDRDIVLELVAAQLDPERVTVEDVMSDDLLTFRETDELLDTMERMRVRGVRRAPVTGKDGELVGILTLDDLLDILTGALANLVQMTGREQRRERETRV